MDMIEGVWGDILFGVRMVFFLYFQMLDYNNKSC